MIRARMPLFALLLVLSLPSLAFASVGEVSLLEGSATRTSKDGETVALKVGSPIEVGDTLKVAEKGNLKLTLTDKSMLYVAAGSELRIDDARFKGQEREGFSAFLSVGNVWAKVRKAVAGSSAKFEVQTDRAVAGVRGTVFRVDAAKLLDAAKPKPGKAAARKPVTVVRVMSGKVGVTERQVAVAQNTSRSKARAQEEPAKPKGPRVQVGGPTQVTAQQWEARFVELQKNEMIMVGEELWHSEAFDPSKNDDAFAQFVNKDPSSPEEE